jgi:hypothetical protein
MLTITQAGPEAAAELLADMHPDDCAEIKAAGISLDLGIGLECRALRLDGRLVCLFGLAGHPVDAGAGIPWMLCTNALAEVPRRWMANNARRIVNEWRAERSLLINMVHRRNRRAVRFIEWLGFDVDRTAAGPGGEFWVFQWRRHV